MVMVAIGTFEWISFRIINKMPKQDIRRNVAAVITILLHNLALAVLIGYYFALVLLGKAKRIRAKKYVDADGVKHYEIYGPLFFASTTAFAENLMS
jgi:SulP family sulfate permease